MPLTKKHNNRIHPDSKKRRSFLTLLFAAGDAWRYITPLILDFIALRFSVFIRVLACNSLV
jgi:hypothetical protein